MITLTPAYGRDYKSRKAAQADFDANKDFIIANFDHRYSGKPVNASQLKEVGERLAEIRYSNNRKVAVLRIK